MNDSQTQSPDALLPAEMALKAEQIGVRKANLSFWPMFVLSILAGAFIAFGAVSATVMSSSAVGDVRIPFGVARLLSGFVFSVGLILVIVAGAELFTGNTLIVMAWASGKVSSRQLLRNWGIVYVGNFIGAAGTALLVFLSGHPNTKNGLIAMSVLESVNAKLNQSIIEAVVLGLLCNVLVCLAVWLTLSCRSTTDKILAIVPPVATFVIAGFEHAIANMYFIPLACLIRIGSTDEFLNRVISQSPVLSVTGPTSFPFALRLDRMLLHLFCVTIGNIIGGVCCVGAVYWFVYLRDAQRAQNK